MKKILILIALLTLRLGVFAQNDRMGNHNGHSSGNSSFSMTEMLLGAILLVVIIGGLVWFLKNNRRIK